MFPLPSTPPLTHLLFSSTGTKIYTLKGSDPDGDALTFGVRGAEGRDLLRIEQNGATEANVYLRKALDREVRRGGRKGRGDMKER